VRGGSSPRFALEFRRDMGGEPYFQSDLIPQRKFVPGNAGLPLGVHECYGECYSHCYNGPNRPGGKPR